MWLEPFHEKSVDVVRTNDVKVVRVEAEPGRVRADDGSENRNLQGVRRQLIEREDLLGVGLPTHRRNQSNHCQEIPD